MEDYFWAAYRDKKREALEWAKQDSLARLAIEEVEHIPASSGLRFRMRIAIGVALVSLAVLLLYANMQIGLALLH